MAVVIYDGECGLCSKFIQFIIKVNKNPGLFITDFTSNWTKANVTLDSEVDSVIYVKGKKQYVYSDAVIHLFADLHPLFKPVYLAKLIPKSIRDAIYKLIARNRRKMLSNAACELPSKKARDMFLA